MSAVNTALAALEPHRVTNEYRERVENSEMVTVLFSDGELCLTKALDGLSGGRGLHMIETPWRANRSGEAWPDKLNGYPCIWLQQDTPRELLQTLKDAMKAD